MEVPILDGLAHLDLYIEDVNLAIMFDGPRHFYSDLPDYKIP